MAALRNLAISIFNSAAGLTLPKPIGDISKTPAAASPSSALHPDIKTHNARTPEPRSQDGRVLSRIPVAAGPRFPNT